ncbi:MAG TPA: tripartite tricarboxylate transporter substrate binding protein [Burkholderiaceae bacterium]|nr:tripartite tricarboxylate transporter substrate binding protein [Burkholderiaceae bacterium]
MIGALGLGLALAAGTAAAADRTIRIVVPFGAGAVQDTIARAISTELGSALNATVIVENRAGAGGSVGSLQVARAAPDGNTLVLAAASHHIVGHLYPKLGYDPLKDFVGVAYLGNSGYVLLTSAALPVTNVAELVRELKANPGKYNYASAGNGSATHLGSAAFLARAGADMVHVPMKSTGDAVNEVVAGRVQMATAATIGVIGFRNDPRVRLLAYTGRTRSKFLPDLPTVAESGLPGFEFDSWIGLLAPAATPKAEVDKINAAVAKVLADPAVQERFTRLGVETSTLPQPEFQRLLAADWDKAGVLVKSSGAKVD